MRSFAICLIAVLSQSGSATVKGATAETVAQFDIAVDVTRIEGVEVAGPKTEEVQSTGYSTEMNPMAVKRALTSDLASNPGAKATATFHGRSLQSLGESYPFQFKNESQVAIGGYDVVLTKTAEGYSIALDLEVLGREGIKKHADLSVTAKGGRVVEWIPSPVPTMSYLVRVQVTPPK